MKLLHLASEYPPAKIYGLGRFVHGLARAQAAQGDQVLVLTNSSSGDEDDVLLDGVHVHRIAFPNPPWPADSQGEVFQWSHGVVSRLLDRLTVFRDVDLVLGHDWLTALAAREVARLLGRPLVVTFHDEIVGKCQGLLRPENRLVSGLEALTAHDANHVIANSQYIAEQVTRHYGLPPAQVTAIPGGIDPLSFSLPAPAEVQAFRRSLASPEEVLFLYVGRLDPEKGLGTLADAWPEVRAHVPQAKLVLAGSGNLEAALRERLVEGVSFLGYVEREALAYLYHACDVALVPSVYEPFGLVALEAMLAGRAVVASDAGGLAEIVRHRRDGLSFPTADAPALAKALLRLARKPALRQRLGDAARSRVLAEHGWSTIAQRTRAVYERVLGQAPRILSTAPTMPQAPLVSAIVTTKGAPEAARATLRSLVARTEHRPLEILIVDLSPDPTQRKRLQVLVDELSADADVPIRMAAEAAEAVATARGDYLLHLTDEVEVPEGSETWLAGLLWILEERQAASASPTLLTRRVLCQPRVLEPRPLRALNPACHLNRRTRRHEASVAGGHWQHAAGLVSSHGELDRLPGAPYRAGSETPLPASVVVVAHNNLDLTREALEAVLAHTAPPFELVLVDNGSRDGTRELFRDVERRLGGPIAVQVLANDENLGYPAGANLGIRAARGKHVVVLNNDTRVRAGWLGALLDAAESQPGVGLVTGKVLNLDGTIQSAGGILHALDGGFEIPGQGEDRLAPSANEGREVENAGGPCLLLTRSLLTELAPDGRPFDEVFSPGYFEDSDLSLRARAAGWKLLYAPGAELFHHGKATANLVAREGTHDVWGQFRRNQEVFYSRWQGRLAADEQGRAARKSKGQRQRVLLCYGRSATTTAAYCERALRLDHHVVTAGPGQELDLGEVSARTLVEAAGGQVDLLLLIEGENYFPTALEEAPCRTAAWLIDNHLHAVDESAWHLDLARAVDQAFLAQRDYLPRFWNAGIDATWLPLACDALVHRQSVPPEGRDLDVVFVGHLRPFHQRRRRLLERLQARFRVHVAEGVYLEDMGRLFARAKIVWNCSLSGDLNMRVFEAMASGALLVTDAIEAGLERLFGPGEHLLLYRDDDLEEVVERALRAPDARQQIAARGQRLALGHHTYRHRMQALMGAVTKEPNWAKRRGAQREVVR